MMWLGLTGWMVATSLAPTSLTPGGGIQDQPKVMVGPALSIAELYRSAPAFEATPMFGGAFNRGYWAVREAVIDKANPAFPQPNKFVNTLGPGRKLLIDFRLLHRLVSNVRVTSATLTLTSADDENLDPGAVKVYRVKKQWLQPPVDAVNDPNAPAPLKNDAGKLVPPPKFGATWNTRDNQGRKWSTAGLGAEDAELLNTQVEVKGREIIISGLTSAIQEAYERPETAYGLAIETEKPTYLWASTGRIGQPKLFVQMESTNDNKRLAAPPMITGVKRTTGNNFEVRIWSVIERPGLKVQWIKSVGDSVTAPAEKRDGNTYVATFNGLPAEGLSKLEERLAVFADGSDKSIETFSWVQSEKTRSIPATAVVAEAWNQNALAQSRFSIATSGVDFQVVPDFSGEPLNKSFDVFGALGLTSPKIPPRIMDDLFPGIAGYGETRSDVQLMSSMMVPTGPWPNPLFDIMKLSNFGPLAWSDVDFLNKGKHRLMPINFLRFNDAPGQRYEGVKVRIYGSKTPLFDLPAEGVAPDAEGVTDKLGNLSLVDLPKEVDHEFVHRRIYVDVESNGFVQRNELKGYQLTDAAARGTVSAAFFDFRVNLPRAPILEGNLARGKSVSDSNKSFPAQLVSLVDDQPDTKYTWKNTKDGWFEIDLGRDRTIASITLKADQLPNKYLVLAYNTGDKVEEALTYAVEFDAGFSLKHQSVSLKPYVPGTMTYFGSLSRVRYLRFVNLSGDPGLIRDIEVRAADVRDR